MKCFYLWCLRVIISVDGLGVGGWGGGKLYFMNILVGFENRTLHIVLCGSVVGSYGE